MVLKHTYLVNGNYMDVADNERDGFMAWCEENGWSPTEVDSYEFTDDSGEKQEMFVPENEREEYAAASEGFAVRPRKMQKIVMDDGQTLNLGDEDLRQYVQARRTGQTMSRGLLSNAGFPDWYGKSREERETLADSLGQFYADDTVNARSLRDNNFGDAVSGVIDNVSDAESPYVNTAVSAAQGFGEGLARSVTDPNALWEETYGDGMIANALKGANDTANKMAGAVAEAPAHINNVSAELVGLGEKAVGGDGELSRIISDNSAAYRQGLQDALPTDTAYVDDSLKPIADAVTDTTTTLFKFAIPGMAPIAISEDTANAYYEAYDQAMKRGMKSDNAEALAAAKSCATAAMGIVLGKAAKGARGASGFKGALSDMAITSAEMGVHGGANDIVDQGIEGNRDIDICRVAKKTAEGTAKGALLGVISRLTHGIADSGRRGIEAEARKTAQKRAEDAKKENDRADARTRYEANLSEEAMHDIERNVNEMVKAEVIPSYRHAEEVAQRAAEKLTRENGESAEAVQMAVMEAAQEVNERLQTTSRVTSPALERRQTEAKMRENERQTRLAEDYAANEAEQTRRETERKGAEINADLDAQREAYEKREKDIKAAFERGDGEPVKKLMDEQKAEMDAYLKEENARKAREEAEQNDPEHTDQKQAPVEGEAIDLRNSPEYAEWLKKSGRNDTDKNWNRYVAENELDPNLKVKRGHDGDAEANWNRRELNDEVSGAINDIRNRIIDRDAKEAAHKEKQNDLDAAFADYDTYIAEADSARKRGGRAKTETPDAIRDAMKDDSVLQRIDAAYKKAKTDAERNALKEQFKARVDELRGNKVNEEPKNDSDTPVTKEGGKIEPVDDAISNASNEQLVAHINNPRGALKGAAIDELSRRGLDKNGKPKEESSKTDAEPQKLTDEMSKTDLGASKTDRVISPVTGKTYKSDSPWIGEQGGGMNFDTAHADEAVSQMNRMAEEIGMPVRFEKDPTGCVVVSHNPHYGHGSEYQMAETVFNALLDRKGTVVGAFKPKNTESSTTSSQKPNGNPIAPKAESSVTTATKSAENVQSVSNGRVGVLTSADKLKAEEKDARKRFKIEKERLISELTAARDNIDNKKAISEDAEKNRAFWDDNFSRYKDISQKQLPRAKDKLDTIKRKLERERMLSSSVLSKEEYLGRSEKYKSALKEVRELEREISDLRRISESMSGEPLKINVGTTEYTVKNNPLAIRQFIENVEKRYGKEASKRYYEIDERTDQHRVDPSLRSDPKVLEWAKKKGWSVVDGKVTPEARRAYDEEMTKKTAKQAKRWFPDMKIVTHKYGENIQRGKEVIDLRDTSGRSLGYFDPNSKEVHLLPGANAETVAHEIMWHGTRDYAETQAAKGDANAKKLLAKMKEVEQSVPEDLKRKVTRLYRANGVSSADVLFNEWGAWFTMGKGGKALEDVLATNEGQAWYAKALSAVKDAYKDYLSAHGGNRTDISQINDMTRDQFVDFLAKEFAGGKTLGEIGSNKGTGKELSTEETAFQIARRKTYDSVAPVRDLEAEVEKKTGKKIAAEDSVDAALALRPGKHEAVAINQKRQIDEVKDMLKKYEISSDDLSYYMSLKAAPGRDAKIDTKNLEKLKNEVIAEVREEWGRAKIDKDVDAFEKEVEKRFETIKASYVSTNGSHVNPKEVSRILPEIENGSKAIEYSAARDKINEIQEDTLDTLVKAGLYSKADAEKLRKEEPNYVPFKSEFDPETGEFVGRAYNNLAKKTFYEAKGRKSAAGDILAHIINDNAMAHHKAIENEAREKLAKLVEAHPELGTVSALGNRTLKEAKRGIGGDSNVILFKREGKTYAIELNGSRGKAVAAAFTGVNQKDMPGWVKTAARAWAATATELSPTFAIRNVTKDNIELAENVIKEMGYIKGSKFIGKYVANQAKSATTLAKYVTTGKIDTSTESGRLLKQFIDDGGMIGGYGSEGYADISRSLSSEQIMKEMKRGTNAAKAAAMHTLHAVSYLNKMSEMTSRFNAYRTQLEMGMSRKEAALWSRRTLTDFNRKGDWTGRTNVLRMFSNSTLGATAKAATGLLTTKTGLSLTAGLLANGAAQAIIEHYSNLDEDENNRKTGKGTGKDVSEYDRKTSFWLIRNAKDGKITKIGSHEGPFQLISYVGNCAARVALGDMTAKDMAKELGLSVAELAAAFSSWGSVNLDSNEKGAAGSIKAFISSAMPSISQPLIEIGTNTDYAGRKVYTEKGPKDNKPYYTRARKNTPQWAKDAAESMNTATGGNEYREGWIDAPAEVVQKLAESFGKNAAKDVITAWETGKAIINGTTDDLEARMIPVKRDFVRDAPDTTSRYSNAKRAFKDDYDEYKGFISSKSISKDEKNKMLEDRPWLRQSDRANAIIDRIEELRHFENSEVKNGRGFTKSKTEFPKEKVEKFKAERLRLQSSLLRIMRM